MNGKTKKAMGVNQHIQMMLPRYTLEDSRGQGCGVRAHLVATSAPVKAM